MPTPPLGATFVGTLAAGLTGRTGTTTSTTGVVTGATGCSLCRIPTPLGIASKVGTLVGILASPKTGGVIFTACGVVILFLFLKIR